MKLRLRYFDLSPEAIEGLRAVGTYLQDSPLGRPLIELVYLRVSQINGCAFCLKKHSKNLRDLGEPQDKLDSLAGWRITEYLIFRQGVRGACLGWKH